MWCWKCSRIRYGWMKLPQILQKLEEPAWKHQFKICALSFISSREEGRVQIVQTDIDRRSKLLCKFAELLKKRDGAHEPVVLIKDFIGQTENPIDMLRLVVQMQVDGEKRIGVLMPSPAPSRPASLPMAVACSSSVNTDQPRD